jgi:HSF-type DNA-binding
MNSKETTSAAFAFQAIGKMKKSSGINSNKKKSSTSSTGTTLTSFKKQRGAPEHKFPVEPTVISIVHKPREYMNHSYRDFSNVPAEIGYEHPTDIRDMTFSQKVHDILSQPEYKAWINWHPHGRSFKIFVPMYFERNVCDKYFGHKRYSSFLRQVSIGDMVTI